MDAHEPSQTKSNASDNTNADKSIVRQGGLYLFVGITSALIEVLLFQLLYRTGILGIELSNIVSVVVATAYNFVLNGRVTFQSQSNKLLSLVKYLLLLVANTTITTFAIKYLVEIGLDSLVAKIIMMVCVACWNFFLYRKFVFV